MEEGEDEPPCARATKEAQMMVGEALWLANRHPVHNRNHQPPTTPTSQVCVFPGKASTSISESHKTSCVRI